MSKINLPENSFLISALSNKTCLKSIEEIIMWFDKRKKVTKHLVERIPFNKLVEWSFEKRTKNAWKHKNGHDSVSRRSQKLSKSKSSWKNHAEQVGMGPGVTGPPK